MSVNGKRARCIEKIWCFKVKCEKASKKGIFCWFKEIKLLNKRMKGLSTFIGIFKLGLKQRKPRVECRNSKNIRMFIDFLYKKGYINGYRLDLSGNKVEVFLKYYNGRAVFPFDNLKVVMKNKVNSAGSLSSLVRKISRSTSKQVIIFNTKYGFVFLEESIMLGVGGYVVCKF